MTLQEIAYKLGLMLIDRGMSILSSTFGLSPIKVSSTEITGIIKKAFPSSSVSHLDNYYYLISADQWKKIIEIDWVDTKDWLKEKRDCDNFANAFCSNASMFYEVNSAGRVYGKLYRGTQEFVGYHYWNVLITDKKEIYFLEPMNDKITKYEGGMLLIGTDKYEPVSFYFG